MEDSSLRQTTVLARRYLDIMMGDTMNTALLLGQAPILAILVSLAFGDISGDTSIPLLERIATQQFQIRFALALAAIWCGTTNAAREICKERPIYLRERMVNLKIESYVLSKIVVLSLLSFVQCGILLVMTNWLSPQGVEGDLVIMFFVLMLISLAGITLGLLISAAVDNPDRAITLVPVVLMPQILFSGVLNPVDQMQSWSRFVSSFMVVRWSVSLLDKLWEKEVASSAFQNELIVLIVFILAFCVLSMQVLNLKEVSLKRAAVPRKVPVAETVICSVCSRKIMSGRTECSACGTAFHVQCMANFCPVCGAPTSKPTFRRVKIEPGTLCALEGTPIKGTGMMCPYCESVFHEKNVRGLDKCPICGN